MTIDPLDKKKHIRTGFVNQHLQLQNFIRDVASRDVEAGMSQCYVLTEEDNNIRGYYTLSGISIDVSSWDPDFKKKHNLKYATIPCTLLGKLAVDKTHQGKAYGKLLLVDALRNAALSSKKVGSALVIVDPIDDTAKDFYSKYGFLPLANTNRMFISMKHAEMV